MFRTENRNLRKPICLDRGDGDRVDLTHWVPKVTNRGLTAVWVIMQAEFLPEFKEYLSELWPFILRIHITVQEERA